MRGEDDREKKTRGEGSTPLELCKRVRGREEQMRRRVSIYSALSIQKVAIALLGN